MPHILTAERDACVSLHSWERLRTVSGQTPERLFMIFKLAALLVSVCLIGLDQLIKYWAVTVLKPVTSIQLIPGVLHFHYAENFRGRLQHPAKPAVAAHCCDGCRAAGHCSPGLFRPGEGQIFHLYHLFGGGRGFGNLVDRIFRGFVVDYIYFVPINFPSSIWPTAA